MSLSYKILSCTGPEAGQFLQGQLSCDVLALQPGDSTPGCYANLKGRVMAAFYIYRDNEGYHLILPADTLPLLEKDLAKYIVFSDAKLFESDTPVTPVLNADKTDVGINVTESAKLIIGDTSEKACDINAWQAHLIQHNIPTIMAAQSEKFLPHYIGLIEMGAVNFDKGCFKGQEVIARMQYRATIKKHVFHTVLDGEQNLPTGEPVMCDDKKVGEVVNSVVTQGKTYVLAEIDDNALPHTGSLSFSSS